MRLPDRILATIQSDAHSSYLVDKVVQLRDHAHAELLFAKTVYDAAVDDTVLAFSAEERDQLKDLEIRAERIKLRHLVGARAADAAWDAAIAWSPRRWQGVIELARQRRCDLIVQDADADEWGNGSRSLTIQQGDLLHHAEVPVMMVKPGPWAPGRAVIAALDVFDSSKRILNRHIVEQAMALTRLLDGELHLVNVAPVSREVAREYGVADYHAWLDGILARRRASLARLVERAGVEAKAIHVLAGVPWKAVAELVQQLGAECLVIGRVRPSVHWYPDTTSERLLHHAHSDVVSVP